METQKKWRLKPAQGKIVAVAMLVVLGIIAFVIETKESRAAMALLKITKNISLGKTTKAELLAMTLPYRQYSSWNNNREDEESVLTFRLRGRGSSHTVMVFSVGFLGEKAVSRDVGSAHDSCCSVEIRQQLVPEVNTTSKAKPFRRLIRDERYLTFNVPLGIDASSLNDVFAYRTECLSRYSACDSVDKLNVASTKMLTESINEGY